MIDTTYNTNQYKLQLVEFSDITAHNTVFPIAYGLIPTESTEAFTWCLTQLKNWLMAAAIQLERREDKFYPLVAITDFHKAKRTALEQVFPLTQRQLCIWHIFQNVRKATRERWLGEKNTALPGLSELIESGDQLSQSTQSTLSDRNRPNQPITEHNPAGFLAL